MRVLWLSLAILIVDQVTKVAVVQGMVPGESIPLLGDLLKLTYTSNPGMAFGLELGSKLFLTLFSIVATFAIAGYLWLVRETPLGYRVALAAIIGGALGNVIDRTFYGVIYGYAPLFYGEVVDFIHVDLYRGFVHFPLLGERFVALFPIWNVADMAITLGVVGVLVTQGAVQRHAEAQKARPGVPPGADARPAEPAEAPNAGVPPTQAAEASPAEASPAEAPAAEPRDPA